jgi:hypothetical protein
VIEMRHKSRREAVMSEPQTNPRTPASGQSAGVRFAWWRWGALALVIACLGYFFAFFEEWRWQPTVDLAWLVASVAWITAFWRQDSSDTSGATRVPQPYWFYALYALCLLPYCTNWRWTMAGDTLNWLFMGMAIADHGHTKSLLSARGPDQFGYLQMNLHNFFMFAVSPTIFWHRVGKIVVAVAAAASIYTVFARLVRPTFGLLVTACTVSCSVWIVYTHTPFPYYDGIAGGFALLATALWVQRDPHSRHAWLILGALSGFLLFLTMNGWFMALCVWFWLGTVALRDRRHVSSFLLAATTGLIVGCPMLWQLLEAEGGQQFDLVQNPQWTVEKIVRFMREAAFMPFSSTLQDNGAFGPQLPVGFRWLFVPGILVTPLLWRRFPGAHLILVIYVVHVLLLAFTQGPYSSVSPKRALCCGRRSASTTSPRG